MSMAKLTGKTKKETRGNQDDRKNVVWMGITSFFTDMSSEMIFPILPLFLTTILHANMALVGPIEGIAESIASIINCYSGWLSDKLGKRKALVVVGYSLSTVTKPFFGFASHWGHVLFLRSIDRVGKGIRTAPRDALIAASVTTNRSKWFGLHRMLDTLGAIGGVIIAMLILWRLGGGEQIYRLIFWLALSPGIFAVLALVIFVKERSNAPLKKNKISIAWSSLPHAYRRLVIITTLFSVANFSYAFFLLRAKDIGVAIMLIPAMYLLYNIVYAATSVPAGKLADRFGKRVVLASGYLLFGVMCWGFAKVSSQEMIWVLFAVYGLFMGITDGVSRAYISDLVDEKQRGSALGIYTMILGILIIPANLVGGLLWDKFGASIPFLLAGVIAVIAALLLIVWTAETKSGSKKRARA